MSFIFLIIQYNIYNALLTMDSIAPLNTKLTLSIYVNI